MEAGGRGELFCQGIGRAKQRQTDRKKERKNEGRKERNKERREDRKKIITDTLNHVFPPTV